MNPFTEQESSVGIAELFPVSPQGQGDFFNGQLGPSALPILIDAFRREPDNSVRAFLLNVIWEFRSPASIPVLAEALNDPDPEVWKQALDGLVTIKSKEARNALQAAKRAD